MHRRIFVPLLVTAALAVGCKKSDDAQTSTDTSSEGSSAQRMMTGTPAPDLAPGERRAFGETLAEDAEALQANALIAQCLDSDAQCVVEGQIGAACRSSGCWFTFTGDDVDALIFVEMEDEAFTIPKNAAGTEARLRGKLTRTEFSASEAFYYETQAARALERPEPSREEVETQGYLFTIDAAVLQNKQDG